MTGSIKDYTPNFNLIIPEFNITGWHDYLEENFRSIDAMFYNLFAIKQYKGLWKNNTIYEVNDVLFIGEDTTYSGRLVKVLVQHTTAGTGDFTEFFENNPTYYETYKDATDAEISAQKAYNWAVKMDGPVEDDLYSSKYYANIVNTYADVLQLIQNNITIIQNAPVYAQKAQDWAISSTKIDNIDYSSKYYAQKAQEYVNTIDITLSNYYTKSDIDTTLSNYQTKANLVTSISSASSDTQYPSAKCMYDLLGDVETLINAL